MSAAIQSYTCLDTFLNPADRFAVDQGDMLASCWADDADRIEIYSRSSKSLVTGGECSQNVIDETDRRSFRRLSLTVYISEYS